MTRKTAVSRNTTLAKLNAMTKERVLAGYQIGFHAIGDKGVQMALDAFAEAEKAAKDGKVKAADGGTDYRLRIEHAQVTTPQQILRFKELKVIASMQPNHLLTDMNWAESRLGPKRAATFLRLGGVSAARSYAGFRHGLSRRTSHAISRNLCGAHAQKRRRKEKLLSRAEAEHRAGDRRLHDRRCLCRVRRKTKRQARARHARRLRRARSGHHRGPAAEDRETKVLRTVVGGKTVYEAK